MSNVAIRLPGSSEKLLPAPFTMTSLWRERMKPDHALAPTRPGFRLPVRCKGSCRQYRESFRRRLTRSTLSTRWENLPWIVPFQTRHGLPPCLDHSCTNAGRLAPSQQRNDRNPEVKSERRGRACAMEGVVEIQKRFLAEKDSRQKWQGQYQHVECGLPIQRCCWLAAPNRLASNWSRRAHCAKLSPGRESHRDLRGDQKRKG